MPRRWPSIRGRNKEQTMAFNSAEAHLQKGFDFAFPSEPAVFYEGCPIEKEYISLSKVNGDMKDDNKREYQPIATLNVRPQVTRDFTSDHSRSPSTRLQQSQYSQASHGPQAVQQVCKILPTCKPNSLQPHHTRESPKSVGLANRRRRRKISEVFRPGADIDEDISDIHMRSMNVEEKKLGLPISRTPWRNPTSPPVVQDDFTTSNIVCQPIDSIVQDKPQHQYSEPYAIESCSPSKKDDFYPQLQVQIPLTPLERFSVMFRDIHGERQSDLLLPDNTFAFQNRSQTGGKDTATVLDLPPSKRRATSPTTPYFGSSLVKIISHGCRSSKYSLFPTTPISLKPCSATASPVRTRRRSITAPGELQNSSVETSSISSGTILQSRNNMQCANNIPETKGPVLSQSETLHHEKVPRILSENEIFFDIKSFRDSNGIDGNHFEMTRPPSAAVQRARSRSNPRKVVRENIIPDRIQAYNRDLEQLRREPSTDTSAQIDATIAIVESLTSSTATNPSSLEIAKHAGPQRQRQFVQPGKQRHQRPSLASIQKTEETINDKSDETANARHLSNAVTDIDGLTQITASNNFRYSASVCSLPAESAPPSEIAKESSTNLGSSANVSAANTTIIPLSKYAPKEITKGLVEASAIPPIRPQRSNTESVIHHTSTKEERPHHRSSKRASSSPENLVHVPKPTPGLAIQVVTSSSQLSDENKAVPMLIAYVKPATEVSIARKVSVTRKQSAKIIEPRSNAKAQILPLPKRAAVPTDSQNPGEMEGKKRFQVDKKLPVVQEVHPRHKPGVSVSAILDSAMTDSSSSLPNSVDLTLRSRLEKALPPIPVS